MVRASAIGPSVTNGAAESVEFRKPYMANVRIQGTADFLFHAWNVEAVEAKGNAAKGSKEKKTDNIESYVYRDTDRFLCIPGEQLRMSIVNAAKYRQDPRSPRKSAMDLFKAGIVTLTPLARIGPKCKKDWDYLHRCRVQVQRSSVTRTRPAMTAGWEAEFQIQVLLPEYISPQILNEVIADAGRLNGIGDFRPTYGRFQVTSFDVGFHD